jgi:glycosyltransferase involved in cell wall biosynthesis
MLKFGPISSYVQILSKLVRIGEDVLIKLSVVIPVYNEVTTIKEVVRRVKEMDIDKEIIIIDDCSTDGTRQLLKEMKQNERLRIFYHEQNQGKGAAIRTGFRHVQGEITIIQDADLEYDPKEYPRLIQPILEGNADVVYGSRFIGGSHRVLLFWHYMGNKLVTLFSNMFTNLNLTDMETGYKVFRSEVIKRIEIRSNRFGMEPEITAKVAKQKCRIYELPISYYGRDYSQGKKITWRDGIAAIWYIIKYRFVD